MNEKALVFFSRDGSTRAASEILARRVKADLIELKEEIPVKGFIRSGYRAMKKKRSLLAGDPWSQCADKDTLILGTPIWAASGTPAMNAFLDKADFLNKRVYLFTVQADPKLRDSIPVLKHLSERVTGSGGTVAGTFALHGASPGKTVSADRLQTLDTWEII